MSETSGADLEALESAVRADLDAKFNARELALKNCRRIIQGSSKAIRALHRGERAVAEELLVEVRTLIAEAQAPLTDHQDIYHAGFFYDAVKEYAEAEATAALLAGDPLPLPADLSMHSVPYLKGLGEAVGELRRRLLDQLRTGRLAEAEGTFADMEAVHDLLTSLDYPDGMTRQSSGARSCSRLRSINDRACRCRRDQHQPRPSCGAGPWTIVVVRSGLTPP